MCMRRVVFDLGSGMTGICALAALASCSKYVYVCPSVEHLCHLKSQLRPNGHRIVCERLRFTTVDSPGFTGASMRSQCAAPVVLIMRLSCVHADISTALVHTLEAATELPVGSLLLFVGQTDEPSVHMLWGPTCDKASGSSVDRRLEWQPVHQVHGLLALQLSCSTGVAAVRPSFLRLGRFWAIYPCQKKGCCSFECCSCIPAPAARFDIACPYRPSSSNCVLEAPGEHYLRRLRAVSRYEIARTSSPQPFASALASASYVAPILLLLNTWFLYLPGSV